MSARPGLLILAVSLLAVSGGLCAPAKAPVAKSPTRGPIKASSARAPSPARLPTLPKKCPYNYTVQPGDTYCGISSKVGISVARLEANNPRIATSNVTAGERFRIPCKPEIDCCPTYITAAAEGLGNVLASRPDLTLDKLLAANAGNPQINATFVRCGTEVRVPCRAGQPVCTGAAYAPKRAPAPAHKKAPSSSPKKAPSSSPKKAPSTPPKKAPSTSPKKAPAAAPKKAPSTAPPRKAPAPTLGVLPKRVPAPTSVFG